MTAAVMSQEAILKAADLWKAGNAADDIALELGVEAKAFERARMRLREFFPKRAPLKPKTGVVPKLWTPERIAQAAVLWNEGRPLSEISQAVGGSPQSISNIASKYRDQFPTRAQKAAAPEKPASKVVANTDRSFVFPVYEGVLVSLPVVRGWSEALS